MALINSSTIIRSLALFHITLAFFFLTSPLTIADQTLVFIIGEAMGLPHARAFDNPSAPLAFLAAVFAVSGVSDLTAVALPDEIAAYHWSSQAPIRLSLFFGLTFYSFAFSAKSPLMGSRAYTSSTWGEGLKNRVFFTWAFVELITWFWVYVTLREERRELTMKISKRRERDDDST